MPFIPPPWPLPWDEVFPLVLLAFELAGGLNERNPALDLLPVEPVELLPVVFPVPPVGAPPFDGGANGRNPLFVVFPLLVDPLDVAALFKGTDGPRACCGVIAGA